MKDEGQQAAPTTGGAQRHPSSFILPPSSFYKPSSITIAIPTLNRGAILVATIERLLALEPPRADAIVVVDQTLVHPPEIEMRLRDFDRRRVIRWKRLPEPSIPHAMNEALRTATTEYVLFLDDDVEPRTGLIRAHLRALRGHDAVVGQILQPGEAPVHHPRPANDLEFRFNHDEGTRVGNVMAGNLSVRRERALAIGGFDEQFVGVAYRFESDFALRLAQAGGSIWYEPAATLRHLQLATGGLRTYGDHRTSASPMHSAGDYYFALVHGMPFVPYALRRLRRNVLTRWHLRHPWTVPRKLLGELRGMALAKRLRRQGRRLLSPPGNSPLP